MWTFAQMYTHPVHERSLLYEVIIALLCSTGKRWRQTTSEQKCSATAVATNQHLAQPIIAASVALDHCDARNMLLPVII